MALGNFFAELKRRHVYRAGGAYAVVAFGLIEIVSNVAPMFDLPGWVGRAVVFALIVGFPITLFAAWMIEAKPAEGAQAPSTSRLDFALMGALVLVVGLLVYQQVAPAQKAAIDGASAEGVSVAVLPFVNLSGDAGQEFFSDGMTEEITSALAKVKGLQVVGRTSAFAFKGQNRDLRAIGQALGATNLLEGSIRKEGNRIRVTGQLIRADNGRHIWTENYDRELTSVFAIQDEIAQAIAGALQVPLGLKSGGTPVAGLTPDADVHEQYLRAKAMYRARLNVAVDAPKVIEAAEAIVARSPDYAPAWGLLAIAYTGYVAGNLPPDEFRRAAETFLPKAEAAGRRAIALDPGSADSYPGLGYALQSRGKFEQAEELFKKGLAIDPYHPDLLHYYAATLQFEGRLKEALAIRRQLLTLEPLNPAFTVWAGAVYIDLGEYEAALAVEKAIPEERGDRLLAFLTSYAGLGRREDAAAAILRAPASQAPPEEAAAAVKLLRAPPTAALPPDLPEFDRLRAVYYFIAPERGFEIRLRASENEIAAGFHFPRIPWSPMFAPMRKKSERFKTLLRSAGLVDYWRARGWPDLCRPLGADDFECS